MLSDRRRQQRHAEAMPRDGILHSLRQAMRGAGITVL